MNKEGAFTLVEILIVISIMALLAVGSFVYFKDFSARQYTNKAVGQVQSLLRLAQSNATSSTKCNNQGATSWSLRISATALELLCDPGNSSQRIYTLENAQVSSITGNSLSCSSNDVTLTYLPGVGTLAFDTSSLTDTSASCIASSQSLIFTITNTLNPGANTKFLIISKGGAINVQ